MLLNNWEEEPLEAPLACTSVVDGSVVVELAADREREEERRLA